MEGAELDVLDSMSDAHWAMVDQMWIEVLDVRGRLARITTLLQLHGFDVDIAVEDMLLMRTLKMFAVTAVRRR